MRSKKGVLSLGLLAIFWWAGGAATAGATEQAPAMAAPAAGVSASAPAAAASHQEQAVGVVADASAFELEPGPVSCRAPSLSIAVAVAPVALSSGICACSETRGCSGVNVGAACTTPAGKPGRCFAVPRFCSVGTDTCLCQ